MYMYIIQVFFVYLRNNCELGAQVVHSETSNVDVINDDASGCWFDDSKQRQSHGALAGSRPTHDANLLTGLDGDVEVFEDEVQFGTILS